VSVENAVQEAVYAALTAVPAMPPVYDHVEQNTPTPYVTIGDAQHNEWDTDDSIGADVSITIHAWSEQRGRKEVKEMLGLIYDTLHRAEIFVYGYHLVTMQYEFSDTFLDPDGVTYHGVCRYRALLEAIDSTA
jgi:hypothetical protein